jgi:outer membrane protein assembly factor BamB
MIKRLIQIRDGKIPKLAGRLTVAGLIAAVVATTAYSSDWPCYRGPNKDGATAESITVWPPQKLWTAPIGAEYAGIVVSEHRVCTVGWSGGNDIVYCFSDAPAATNPATPLWTYTNAVPGQLGGSANQGIYVGSKSAPTVDGNEVYTISINGILNCLNKTTGALLWTKTITTGSQPDFGITGSPLIEGNLVIVNACGHGVAVDKTTHNVVWGDTDTTPMHGYATPYAVTIGSTRTIVMYSDQKVYGLDPATGSTLWWANVPWALGQTATPDPIICNGKLWVATLYGQGCGTYTLGSAPSGQLTQLYMNSSLECINCAVLSSNYVYGVDYNAQVLKCLDPATCTVMWNGPSSGYGGVIMMAGGQLVLLNGSGSLSVLDATSAGYTVAHPGTQVVTDISVNIATCPTIANGIMYVRGGGTISAYKVGATSGGPTAPPVITPPVVNYLNLYSGMQGSPFTLQIVATNSPSSYTASPLPGGLTLNPVTGLISGLPTTPGDTTVSMTASNSLGVSPVVTVYVHILGTSVYTGTTTRTPYHGTPMNIPTTQVMLADYDLGGEGVAYHDDDLGSHYAGGYRVPADDVDVGDGSSVGVHGNGGEWTTYSLNFTQGGTFDMQFNANSANASGHVHFEIDGTNITGSLPIDATGSWTSYTHTYSAGTISAGPHIMRMFVEDQGGMGLCWVKFVYTGAGSAPVISSALTASGTVGQSFPTYTITANNSPTSFNAVNLPSGLSVSSSSGQITGTPTTPCTNAVTISASNTFGVGTATLTITINGSTPTPPTITSALAYTGTVGAAVNYQITASGSAPMTYSASPLPPGLGVNTNSGAITGTPTTNGVTAVTIRAMNSYGTNSATLSITINLQAPGPSGLVGWWKLDESSGTTAADSSGNGNSGTLSGGTWQVSGGHIAGALHFNAFDSVNCGATTSLNTPSVTVAFWMKADSLGNMIPVDKLPTTGSVGYAVKLRDTGSIWFRVGAEGGPALDVYGANGIYASGTWVHVACTFDSATGNMRMYINGVVESHQPTFATSLNASSIAFRIASITEPYSGSLDDVRVYDHALTAAEIVTVMSDSSGVQAPRISSIRPNGSNLGISWVSDAGTTYTVYKSTNLLTGWLTQPLTNIVGDGSTQSFFEAMGSQKCAYYRIKAD